MPMISSGFLFLGPFATQPSAVARIAHLATEMRAGHMGQYGYQVEGTELYRQVIKGLVTVRVGS